MTTGFEGQVENFDGVELVGWVSFDGTSEPEIFVEISGFGCRQVENLHQRADLAAAKGQTAREFRILLDALYPGILDHSGRERDANFCLNLSARHSDGTQSIFFEFVGSWGLLHAAASTRPKSDGRIDSFDEKWIGGWVITDTSDLAKIDICANDRVIANTVSGLYRADVARLYSRGHYSGFLMATPEALCDGFPHTVSVRLSSGWVFPGFPREIRLGKTLGVVDRIETNLIEGWFGFLRNSNQSAKMLTILCNGERIGVTNFRAPRPDITAKGLAASAFSFRFETKRGIFVEDTINVVDDSSGFQLRVAESAKAANLPSAIAGHLDQASESEIVGWAVDRRSPSETLRIIAYSDGAPVAEVNTEGFRADVQRSFPLAMRPGFTIRTPDALRDGKLHQIELRVSGGSRALSGTPTTIQLSKRSAVFRAPAIVELGVLDQRIQRHLREDMPGTVAYKGLDASKGRNRRKRNAQKRTEGVSHIILNKNGGDVFLRCLESLLQYMDFRRDELIVVDHASNDVSREALERLEQAGLAKVIWKPRNDSFSKSNNDAAAVATKTVLLLLNNDIEFVSNISRNIEDHLRSPEIGAVGIKLYDIVERSSEEFIARNLHELRIQHLGVWFHPGHANNDFNLSGYDITTVAAHREIFGLHEVAVVTGAALGIRTEDFNKLGGLDETYFYGTEDIDLCLRVRRARLRVVCDRNLEALHVRGYTRFTHRGGGASDRFSTNNKHLWTKFGASMRRDYLRSLVARDGIFCPPTFRIGFAVTEANSHTVAGDYFTALELARALAGHSGIEYVFLSEKEDWYDCNGLDAVVVMRHDYDLRRVRNQKSHCLFFGWARNQFETWLHQPWVERFDAVLSSSKLFSDLLYRSLGIRAHTLYIATSFNAPPASGIPIEQDVVFVGSRWGGAREIEQALVPERINGSIRIYGTGFGDVPHLHDVWGGVLPYSAVEATYHRSRIVVDDANATTKRWGSPNSRVFDAIAAGAVVLTNSAATSEVLGRTLPVWHDADELSGEINYLLANEEKLSALAAAQASVVKGRHSYTARASAFLDLIAAHADASLRIDILTAVPREANPDLWGDWHFALSLARALRKKGHAVRVRKLNEKADRATDVVLGLRGLQRFVPVIGAINLLWIISHPDQIAAEELKGWQHVFVASQTLADRFGPFCLSISVLEQATDCKPSSLWAARRGQADGTGGSGVFVGNTRGVARPFIDMAAGAGLDFRIWGDGWKGSALEDRVVASSIENRRLGELYASASFVLSDHWPDMAEQGIVSNRVFDALAAGGVVITDPVAGLDSLRLPNVFVCMTHEDISEASLKAMMISDRDRWVGGATIAQRFSFENRASLVLDVGRALAVGK
nr:glycosyltransferase [uncultured Rhodopila sp.]